MFDVIIRDETFRKKLIVEVYCNDRLHYSEAVFYRWLRRPFFDDAYQRQMRVVGALHKRWGIRYIVDQTVNGRK